MKVWVGVRKGERYVHQWMGDVVGYGDTANAIMQALADYAAETQEPLWDLTVQIDNVSRMQAKQLH
jgi:hypothetical protein